MERLKRVAQQFLCFFLWDLNSLGKCVKKEKSDEEKIWHIFYTHRSSNSSIVRNVRVLTYVVYQLCEEKSAAQFVSTLHP